MTPEEKNALIDARIKQYEQRKFQTLMNSVASEAIGDETAVKESLAQIEQLDKAIVAVSAMKEM